MVKVFGHSVCGSEPGCFCWGRGGFVLGSSSFRSQLALQLLGGCGREHISDDGVFPAHSLMMGPHL